MDVSPPYRTNPARLWGLIVIVVTLAAVAVPIFASGAENIRCLTRLDDLLSSFTLARSEAIRRNTSVTVCAGISTACLSGDWTLGWVIFYTDPDSHRPILVRRFPAIADFKLSSSGGSRFVFNEVGRVTPMSTFVLCDSRGDNHALAMDLDVGGIAKIGTKPGFNVDGVTAVGCDLGTSVSQRSAQ